VKFSCLQPFIEHSLTVTDGDGKPVPQPTIIPDIGERDAGGVESPPGKEIELHQLQRQLLPASESGGGKEKQSHALYGPGKVAIQYQEVLGRPEMARPNWKLDPALRKLATGRLELEVMRVFTSEELIREANSLKPDEKVAVQFEVRMVQRTAQAAGHGPDDLGLCPYDRVDWTQKQFTAILTVAARQQLKRLGIVDARKHLVGKIMRATGRVSSYLPLTDEPVSERQYELVIEDVSQIESVVAKGVPPARK
jgi:hypothetical protein